MAKKIIDGLNAKELIIPTVPPDKVLSATEEIILKELTVEDRLHEEIREILKKHGVEIERSKADYRKLFELTKQKLVKERNLIL